MNVNMLNPLVFQELKKITIVSHTSSEDKEWSELCIGSQREYAEKHGFEYCLHEDVDTVGRHPGWSRFRILQGRAASGQAGEVVVWMDSDVVVMNPDFNIRPIIEQFATDPSGICHFPMGGAIDLGVMLMKPYPILNSLFQVGWDAGKVEAHGNRRDKLSIELMGFLEPGVVKGVLSKEMVSTWYPPSPLNFFNVLVDSAEESRGIFWMNKPKAQLENFPDLYAPGCFTVHLHEKGPRLRKTSEDFLLYRKSLSDKVEKAQKLTTDIS